MKNKTLLALALGMAYSLPSIESKRFISPSNPNYITRDRFGLVIVNIKGEDYIITDIGMRMLQPHELYAAQGFPKNYIIATGKDGEAISKTAQVRLCGNSVSPPIARALVDANVCIDARLRSAI